MTANGLTFRHPRREHTVASNINWPLPKYVESLLGSDDWLIRDDHCCSRLDLICELLGKLGVEMNSGSQLLGLDRAAFGWSHAFICLLRVRARADSVCPCCLEQREAWLPDHHDH